jgi:hypothetical protein
MRETCIPQTKRSRSRPSRRTGRGCVRGLRGKEFSWQRSGVGLRASLDLRAVDWFTPLGVTQSARFNPWPVLGCVVFAVAVFTARILVALLALAFRSPYLATAVTNGFSEGHAGGCVMSAAMAVFLEGAGFVIWGLRVKLSGKLCSPRTWFRSTTAGSAMSR